jgi:AcrR family transcriptional regulator
VETVTTKRGDRTADLIRSVACDLFYKQGFQATALRDLAQRVGIQVGSLYNHIDSKRNLLFEIMETVMLDLLAQQRKVAQTEDVVERLRLLIHGHVRFHVQRAREVFIGNSELRSLDRVQRARMVGLRREYEMLFRDVLGEGIAQGRFDAVDVPTTTYGILAMTTWVSTWFSARGPLTPDDIAEIYAGLVLRGIGVLDMQSHDSPDETDGYVPRELFVMGARKRM